MRVDGWLYVCCSSAGRCKQVVVVSSCKLLFSARTDNHKGELKSLLDVLSATDALLKEEIWVDDEG